jgi:hypothetical protein
VTHHHPDDTAEAGRPASAVSSGEAARPDVVPADARVELDRLRRRWGELPLDTAQARMPLLRRLVEDLTDRWADELGRPLPAVPDLGPAAVVDQLTVVVWDAYATGRGDGIPPLLAELRRALR